jgi:hypothetical protein
MRPELKLPENGRCAGSRVPARNFLWPWEISVLQELIGPFRRRKTGSPGFRGQVDAQSDFATVITH